MNKNTTYINQRLSLRKPLGEALEMVESITDVMPLEKPDINNLDGFLSQKLKEVQTVCPQCTDFERDFPSLSFSIATGIGKTRLMAAIITYLYLQKKVRHFFILAPNLPIYQKLNRDFGKHDTNKDRSKGCTKNEEGV